LADLLEQLIAAGRAWFRLEASARPAQADAAALLQRLFGALQRA
jgi:hypothetical protein